VCLNLGLVMFPIGVNAPAPFAKGSKISALASAKKFLLSVASARDQNFAVRQQGHLMTATPLVHVARRCEQACSRIINFGCIAGDLGIESGYRNVHPAGTFEPRGLPRRSARGCRVRRERGFNTQIASNTAEIYDPATGLFTPYGQHEPGAWAVIR